MECIEKEDYDAVEQYWSYSAAGDGYGDDNCFIDFNYIDNASDGMDIQSITSILSGLKKQEKKEYEQRRSQLFKQTRKEHPNWGNKRVKTYCNSILELKKEIGITRKCSSLKENEQVIFKVYSDILIEKSVCGTVIVVYPDRKEVMVSYFDKDIETRQYVSYEDMLAVYNKNSEKMYLENIDEPIDLLIAE